MKNSMLEPTPLKEGMSCQWTQSSSAAHIVAGGKSVLTTVDHFIMTAV